MKKSIKILGLFVLVGMIMLTGLYFLLGYYYTEGFPCFTWINGVYCTGKSVEELNKELVSKYKCQGLKVVAEEGAELYIGAEDVDLKVDYTNSLNDFLAHSNPYAWGINLFKNMVMEYQPDIYYDRALLNEKIANWEIFEDKEYRSVYITRNDGYELVNELVRVPNIDKITDAVNLAFDAGDTEIDLYNTEGCYEDLPLSDSDLEKIRVFDEIDKLQNCNITYNLLGNEVKIDKKLVSEWILTDRDLQDVLSEKQDKKLTGSGLFIAGNKEISDLEEIGLINEEGFLFDDDGYPLLSERKMYTFLEDIANKYDTSWCMNNYRNGAGTEIMLNDNSRGNGRLLDIDTEFEALKEAFLSGTQSETVNREISLLDGIKTYDAAEKLGKTYIEVDMGEQKLSYYVDGQLNMEMPVVTGNINRGRGTPAGIYDVYNKRYHTYLRGADYVSYVNYWLGVNKGVGIHDANWRSKFGEEIYKRDGSHGCINCPESQVSVLWEVVEVGTPVVLYY